MKKLFAFLLVATFAFAFVACGGASTETEATEETTTEGDAHTEEAAH